MIFFEKFIKKYYTYLNFHIDKAFAIVDSHDRPYHFRNNDHISQMGLYRGWLFTIRAILLRHPQLLKQCDSLSVYA